MKAMKEIWKPIPGYEDSYEISNLGQARSLDRTLISKSGYEIRKSGVNLRLADNGKGYKFVALWVNNKQQLRYIHRLVLEAFSPTDRNDVEVAHNNGSRNDNRLSNLRWATKIENEADKKHHGTALTGVAKVCKRGHMFTEENTRNYANNKRFQTCRSCNLMLGYFYNRGLPLDEALAQEISDIYYAQILSGEPIFYKPVCDRGHALSGSNLGFDSGKRFCRSCKAAGRKIRKQSDEDTEERRQAVSDIIYETTYGGGLDE